MSSNNDSGFANFDLFQLSKTVFEGFNSILGASQHSGQGGVPGVKALSPEAFELAKQLQVGWLEQQGALWHGMTGSQMSKVADGATKVEYGDKRFENPAWTESPFYDYLRQSYLLNSDYLKRATELVEFDDSKAKARMRFLTRQVIDAMAPSNFIATNPEFINTALETNGESIRQGLQNLISDLEKGRISMTDDAAFEVGRNLAVTPGAVVFENELMQLIQYSPLTEKVGQCPFLMVPPCINKYYILDLQPENSLVRYAVEQGNTVFLVSWRNVKADLGHLTWDNYIESGPLAALKVVQSICKVKQVNALGFCVGGTLLSAALAVAKARGENPVASLTLLTTLLDFSDTGEIGCLVDEGAVQLRESTIGKGGILPGSELATVFSALRANDLIWQYVVGNYLKGNKPAAFDLLYWNSDATNLPGPFLAWYLRNMYLENSFRIPNKLSMCGEKIDLTRLDMPSFIYASREDHIVPWKTSYESQEILGGETTFVLGASGHIAGVINPAIKNKRSYWVNNAAGIDAAEWLDGASEIKGSWWPVWAKWLRSFAGRSVPARTILGSTRFPVLEAAPGRYVKEAAK